MRTELRTLTALLATGLMVLATASFARAADTVYWGDYGSGHLGFANLAGGGGGFLDLTGASADKINGLAIDSVAGRIYWADSTPGSIQFANLGGGGGGVLNIAGATDEPSNNWFEGLAIDPAAGKIYWGNEGEDKISWANLNGSGGGDLDTGKAPLNNPFGIAIDPAAGRVYWTNRGATGGIAFANLSGGSGGEISTAGATMNEPAGLAIDKAGGRIYWGNYETDTISFANLNGTGGGDLNTAGATVDGPFGVAVDPVAGRVYWTNETDDSLASANLVGGGGAKLDTTGVTPDLPDFPVLLRTPSPAAPPAASGASKPGSTLTCTPGTWAPDLLESYLYRAPQSTGLQWLKNGQPIAGATAPTLKASKVGSYVCQSIGTNHAGATTQSAAGISVYKVGKTTLNKKKGTATVTLEVPGSGTATLSGKKVAKKKAKRSAASPGKIKLLVKAKGKANKTLAKKGKVKIKATVGFAPLAGSATSQTVKVTLKKKLSG